MAWQADKGPLVHTHRTCRRMYHLELVTGHPTHRQEDTQTLPAQIDIYNQSVSPDTQVR